MSSDFDQQFLTDIIQDCITDFTHLKRLSLVQNKNKLKEDKAEMHVLTRLDYAI